VQMTSPADQNDLIGMAMKAIERGPNMFSMVKLST
jgi:hypothetical protein